MVKSSTKGRFIVFEGVEGCGKSTVLSEVAKALTKRGRRVATTREPGGTPLGEKLRHLVLSKEGPAMAPLTELLLIEAARHEHCRVFIEPHLRTHDFVLCDRFTLSSLAYQGYARGLSLEAVAKLNDWVTQSCPVDMTFILRVPESTAWQRRQSRKQHTPDSDDRMEQEDKTFHQSVEKGYEAALAYAQPYHTLDGSAPLNTLTTEVLALLGES